MARASSDLRRDLTLDRAYLGAWPPRFLCVASISRSLSLPLSLPLHAFLHGAICSSAKCSSTHRFCNSITRNAPRDYIILCFPPYLDRVDRRSTWARGVRSIPRYLNDFSPCKKMYRVVGCDSESVHRIFFFFLFPRFDSLKSPGE